MGLFSFGSFVALGSFVGLFSLGSLVAFGSFVALGSFVGLTAMVGCGGLVACCVALAWMVAEGAAVFVDAGVTVETAVRLGTGEWVAWGVVVAAAGLVAVLADFVGVSPWLAGVSTLAVGGDDAPELEERGFVAVGMGICNSIVIWARRSAALISSIGSSSITASIMAKEIGLNVSESSRL